MSIRDWVIFAVFMLVAGCVVGAVQAQERPTHWVLERCPSSECVRERLNLLGARASGAKVTLVYNHFAVWYPE